MGLQRDTFIRSEIKNIIPVVWEDVEKYAMTNLVVTSVQQHSTIFALFVLLFLQYLPVIDIAAFDIYFCKQAELKYTRAVRKVKNVYAYNPHSCFIVPDQSFGVFSRV
jgi:hypothetical protein